MPMTPIPAEPGKKLDHIINTWAEHRVVEQIECQDGYKLSVQAFGMHYCSDANDRRDFYWAVNPVKPPLPFSTVEVSADGVPESWADYDGDGVHAFVPVSMVRAFIESHGGEKGATTEEPSQLDRIEALLVKIAENTSPTKYSAALTDFAAAGLSEQSSVTSPRRPPA